MRVSGLGGAFGMSGLSCGVFSSEEESAAAAEGAASGEEEPGRVLIGLFSMPTSMSTFTVDQLHHITPR